MGNPVVHLASNVSPKLRGKPIRLLPKCYMLNVYLIKEHIKLKANTPRKYLCIEGRLELNSDGSSTECYVKMHHGHTQKMLIYYYL